MIVARTRVWGSLSHGQSHQGLGNRLIGPDPGEALNAGDVKRRERLGGMLSFYHREAA